MGAAFLLIVLAGVLFTILWRKPAEVAPVERSFKPLDRPAASRGQDRVLPPGSVASVPSGADHSIAAAPKGLAGLIGVYLSDRRFETTVGTRDADLICHLPEGGSLFKVHAELSTAVRVWGGTILSGEEKTLDKGRRALDLAIARRGETIRLRLLHEREAPREARIALVIDDFGFQEPDLIGRFLDLPIPFTPAILPGYPRSIHAARWAEQKGRRPILHLPMEPKNYPAENPGPGALFVRMNRAEKRAIVEGDLLGLAAIVGVSNHMGSRASEDTALAGAVLDLLRDRRLFFLDSGTSMHSVFPAEAARRGVPCLAADLFLDGEANPTPATMGKRLAEARDLALRTGSVILIGHARPATLAFLTSVPDSLRAWGCSIVPLADLLR